MFVGIQQFAGGLSGLMDVPASTLVKESPWSRLREDNNL